MHQSSVRNDHADGIFCCPVLSRMSPACSPSLSPLTVSLCFRAAFFEERAILLGRLGRHEQALTIYVHILRDPDKALEYCRQHYSSERPADSRVSFLCRRETCKLGTVGRGETGSLGGVLVPDIILLLGVV